MKIKFFALTLLVALIAFGCKNSNKTDENQNVETMDNKELQETKESALAFNPDSVVAEPIFDIVTTMGTIRIKLYEDTPKHRDNFVKLASERFFDGILFHRIIPNFMIQAGDPNTKDPNADPQTFGTGDPGYKIPAEILPNHRHKKGALAAARQGGKANPERKSSGSQFYLVQDEQGCSHLDGEYTIFGETISGLDIIDAIAAVPTGARDIPTTPVKIIRVDLVKE